MHTAHRYCHLVSLVLLLTVALVEPTPAATRFVWPDGSGIYPTIQLAIDASEPGDTVALGDGVFSGAGNVDLNFGGRSIVVRALGNDAEVCIIECAGSPSDPHRGFLFQAGETESSIVEYLTIRNGYDSGVWNTGGGGGIRCEGASPTIRGCRILDCEASWVGGAIAVYYASPRFEDCWVQACTMIAIHIEGGAPLFRRCTVVQNDGGVHTWSTQPQFENCTFVDNHGVTIVYVDGFSSVSMQNCIVAFNQTTAPALDRNTGTMTLSCCDVYGNALGDWIGFIAGQESINGNLSMDPMFCDQEALILSLHTSSPCGPFSPPNTECGLIGAWPVGCGMSLGACCETDGTCLVISEETCVPPNVWLGEDTYCEPNPCTQEVGACCLSEVCRLVPEWACRGAATFQGVGTTCDPNPCGDVVGGSVTAWGFHGWGECSVPEPNEDFVQIAAGGSRSYGLKADGSVRAWGRNLWGECDVPEPNGGFVSVAGGDHVLGLRGDGSVIAWGRNDWGQCNVPTPNAGFVAASSGGEHSVGLKVDGSVVAWGRNNVGQCDAPSPNTGAVAVVAGWNYSAVLRADGSIVAWGDSVFAIADVPTPNSGFVAIAGGGGHILALRDDGSIAAWGCNDEGQCDVPGVNADFVAVAGGSHHSLGLRPDGSIVAWGWNNWGQSSAPTPNYGYSAIAGGYEHSLALRIPATTGACCDEYGACLVLQADACQSPSSWLGPETPCDPNPCPQLGACCLGNACLLVTEEECQGAYQGDLVPCVPNPCPAVSVPEALAPGVLAIRPFPNPSGGGTVMLVSGPAATAARVSVFDSSGRLVREVWQGAMGGQAFEVAWDGRDDAGRAVSAGVYLVQLAAGQAEVVARVVRSR